MHNMRLAFLLALAPASALRPGSAAMDRRSALAGAAAFVAAPGAALAGYERAADPFPSAIVVSARPEGVNKPELLAPNGADGKPARVMQMSDVNYLASKQIVKLDEKLKKLEAKTGVKVRVLCQRYPNTPGLAIKDYWGVDDKTIVLIADRGLKGTSNILNFNVGASFNDVGSEYQLPTVFWTRLSGKFGSTFYMYNVNDGAQRRAAVTWGLRLQQESRR